MNKLREFAEESNRISGAFAASASAMYEALDELLGKAHITADDLTDFNDHGYLRDIVGLDVRIGDYIPPPGGSKVVLQLDYIMEKVEKRNDPMSIHIAFEKLHPYTGGNGRTGRALWLWQMDNQRNYDMEQGFLHTWYYQSLS